MLSDKFMVRTLSKVRSKVPLSTSRSRSTRIVAKMPILLPRNSKLMVPLRMWALKQTLSSKTSWSNPKRSKTMKFMPHSGVEIKIRTVTDLNIWKTLAMWLKRCSKLEISYKVTMLLLCNTTSNRTWSILTTRKHLHAAKCSRLRSRNQTFAHKNTWWQRWLDCKL